MGQGFSHSASGLALTEGELEVYPLRFAQMMPLVQDDSQRKLGFRVGI